MNGHYHRSKKGAAVNGSLFDLPEQWDIHYKDLTLSFKAILVLNIQVFFPSSYKLDWFGDKIRNAGRPVKVLNLFAYTGGATWAAAAGASVTHVDASKGMVTGQRRMRGFRFRGCADPLAGG